MKTIIVLLFLILTACGSNNIDREFDPYLSEIKKDFSSKGLELHINYSIEFISKDLGNINGRCVSEISNRRIEIQKNKWELLSWDQRYWLLVHEIGHCSFNLGHENHFLPSGEPASAMNEDASKVAMAAIQSEEIANKYLEEIVNQVSDWFF